MATRAKFMCLNVTDHGHNKTVRLQAVYSRKEGTESRDFTTATPSGTLEMTINNPLASCQFKPMRNYYLDISECPEAQQNHDPDGKHKGNVPMEALNPVA